MPIVLAKLVTREQARWALGALELPFAAKSQSIDDGLSHLGVVETGWRFVFKEQIERNRLFEPTLLTASRLHRLRALCGCINASRLWDSLGKNRNRKLSVVPGHPHIILMSFALRFLERGTRLRLSGSVLVTSMFVVHSA
eukprot:Skav212335  [mRNA]  locus=scaffold1488:6978:13013:+ [translate_table: standard]